MNSHRLQWLMPGTLLALLAACASGAAAQDKPIHIGLARTFLSEQSKGVVQIATDDFKGVLKQATDLDGVINSKLNSFEIADKLDGKQLQFGIFHAHEFAWVQAKHPDLVPLLIAVDKHVIERANVIVKKDSPARSLADLRGKKIDLPVGTKEHCRVYLEQACRALDKKAPAEFFGAIEKSANKKAALDAVAAGAVDAAVIDLNGLEFYKEIRGPVFAKNLRVLEQSAAFPPAVVAYKKGTVDARTLDAFTGGLLKAHTIPDGRDMMKSWNFEQFSPVPEDYARSLADVLRAFPPPTAKQ
jgi:ABC-type phosphate/phosphonate transport system substrate-binding protein